MQVVFIETDGTRRTVAATAGESLMMCAARHLIPGIIGECGGAMACATCHAYVADEWAATLPPPSTHEREMLEGCLDPRPNSRLTCQIRLETNLDGLTVELPGSQV